MRKTLNKFMIILIVLLGTLILGMGTVKGAVSLGGNTSVKQGDTVRITVYYGETVKTAQFIFQYDATKLTYVSVVGGSYNPATGRFSATSEEKIDTLSSATFTFTAKETGSAVFNIASVKFLSVDKGKFDPVVSNTSISTTINPKTTPKPPVTDPEKPSGGNSGNSGSNTKPSDNNTTTKKPTFSGGTTTVYATETVSIRDSWSTSGKLLGTLQKNKSITRTGIGSNGWSRVSYNGKTAYINSSYLTTTKPKDDKKDDNKDDDKNNTTNKENNTTNNETTNNEVNNTTNNTENNEVNNTSNELVNNEYQGSNEVKDEKKDGKKYIEFIIIGVIIVAILVIIISEISAKKRSKKKSSKR